MSDQRSYSAQEIEQLLNKGNEVIEDLNMILDEIEYPDEVDAEKLEIIKKRISELRNYYADINANASLIDIGDDKVSAEAKARLAKALCNYQTSGLSVPLADAVAYAISLLP